MATTPKQKAVFDYIKNYIDENGFSPTFEEIAHRFHYKSKGTVYKHIKALKLKGLLRQEWNRVRSIQLASRGKRTDSLLPLKAEWRENNLLWQPPPFSLVGVSPDIAPNNRCYVLSVNTDALAKQQIARGDRLVAQPFVAERCGGRLIVAVKKGTVALRKSTWSGSPEKIIGQITGLIRKY
ncbi:MAG: hypothetical protein U9N31_05190 [Candidatus Marinimicrobia bacterium]|nr:hypothetical protein [Candidatus Neomarinimicrobiota bacterium]